jgi:hypothetical protein
MTDHFADLHPTRKGGLLPPIIERPRLNATPFLATALPVHPESDLAPVLNYPMDLNDQVGDCVVAGWDHFCQVVNHLLGQEYVNLSQDQLIELYKTQNPTFDLNSATNGPGSAADGGMVMQLFLEELRRRGLILAFAEIDFTNSEVMEAATYVFLGVLLGAGLQEAQVSSQFDEGQWDYVPGQPFIGGHCIPAVGYKQCVSWGKIVGFTQRFLGVQVQEAWVVITQAHLDHPGFRNNFDVAGFAAAYQALTGKTLPVPVPTPAPPAPSPVPTPAPAPSGGGASFLVGDPGVVARLEQVAAKRHMTPNDWLTRHLEHYFRLYSLVELDQEGE